MQYHMFGCLCVNVNQEHFIDETILIIFIKAVTTTKTRDFNHGTIRVQQDWIRIPSITGIYWLNLHNLGGMDRAFQGVVGLLQGISGR